MFLNRLIAFDHECKTLSNDDCHLILELNNQDTRALHISSILKLKVGDEIRCGIVNKGMTNHAKILSFNGPKDHGNILIDLGDPEDFIKSKPPSIDLILAVPRPLRLERLIPIITCMGVRRLFLIGASKVEKAYFGSHLFTRPEEMMKCIVEGLSQVETDYHLPEIIIKKNLSSFIYDDIPILFDNNTSFRGIAHPPLDSLHKEPNPKIRFSSIVGLFEKSTDYSQIDKVVLAIGPEGGWEEEEVQLFERIGGFHRISLGNRILRTDIAVQVLLGLAHEWLDTKDVKVDQV